MADPLYSGMCIGCVYVLNAARVNTGGDYLERDGGRVDDISVMQPARIQNCTNIQE